MFDFSTVSDEFLLRETFKGDTCLLSSCFITRFDQGFLFQLDWLTKHVRSSRRNQSSLVALTVSSHDWKFDLDRYDRIESPSDDSNGAKDPTERWISGDAAFLRLLSSNSSWKKSCVNFTLSSVLFFALACAKANKNSRTEQKEVFCRNELSSRTQACTMGTLRCNGWWIDFLILSPGGQHREAGKCFFYLWLWLFLFQNRYKVDSLRWLIHDERLVWATARKRKKELATGVKNEGNAWLKSDI